MTDQIALDCISKTCSDTSGRIYENKIKQNKELLSYIESRYNDSDSIKETIFRMKNKIEIRPSCIRCGNRVRFDGRESHRNMRNNGFYWHCSTKCMQNDTHVREKIKETCVARYGAEHNWCKNSSVRYKCESTLKERYSGNWDEIVHKTQRTKLEKYGDKNYNGIRKFVDSLGDNFKEFYSNITKKSEQTKLERYGNPKYNNIEKGLKTKLERYGTLNPGMAKTMETTRQRYGVDCLFKIPEIHALCNTKDSRLKMETTKNKNGTNRRSNIEKEISDYISKSYNLSVENNKRKYLDGLEIDIYLPDIKLGFEIQGDFYHANPKFYKETDYIFKGMCAKDIWEKDKTKKKIAKEKGIDLIELWEHDIIHNTTKVNAIIDAAIKNHL